MADKEVEKEVDDVIISYIAKQDAVVNNNWYPRGTILKFPKSLKFKHAKFAEYKDGDPVIGKSIPLYDPVEEAIKAERKILGVEV